jgi:hypothetical protein
MNVRAFLVVPAALAVAVLAGCGQTDGVSNIGSGSGAAQVRMPSTELCHAPDYMRKRVPEGLCVDVNETQVVDDLSPLHGDR